MTPVAALAELVEKRYVSPVGAAAIADRHPETIREALRSGELHGTQRVTGGNWKVQPGCVIAWADGEVCEHRKTDQPVSLSQYRQRRAAQ